MNKTEEKIKLRETVRILERKLGLLSDNELSCCSITMAQCHAIVEIGRAGNISLIDLSKLLNLDNSTLSRTVNNLVKGGLAIRELDPNDRRYVTISLTQKGLDICNKIESDMNVQYSEIYESIPEEKRAQVLESLQILVDVFNRRNYC